MWCPFYFLVIENLRYSLCLVLLKARKGREIGYLKPSHPLSSVSITYITPSLSYPYTKNIQQW